MIAYILHVTVITTICFLFYKLLLQKETFYRLNRWMLMGCLAVSFGLPLLPVPQAWSWRYAWQEQKMALRPEDRKEQSPAKDMTDGQYRGQAMGDLDGQKLAMTSSHLADRETSSRPVKQENSLHHVKQEKVNPRHGHAAVQAAGAEATRATQLAPAGWQESAAESRAAGWQPEGQSTTSGYQVTSVAAATAKINPGTPVVRLFSLAFLFFALQWFFYAYLFGALLFGGNFLLQLAVLLYQSYARPVIRDGRFRIVEINGNRAPCSFGNTIFINPANYDWDTYNQILIHEKIHVSGRHTVDILLAELAVVLQWFNPFVWLYRREVENNLEFLTDASVLLHQEVERSAYQLSLLRVSAPHMPFSITNNYNQSLLKRRIVMMNSKSSSTHTVWKYFFLIPLLTGLVCALNKPAALGATNNGNGLIAGNGASGWWSGSGNASPLSWLGLATPKPADLAPFADTTVHPVSSGKGRSKSDTTTSGEGYSYSYEEDIAPMPQIQVAPVVVIPEPSPIIVDPSPAINVTLNDQLNMQLDQQVMANVQFGLPKDVQFGLTKEMQMGLARSKFKNIDVQVDAAPGPVSIMKSEDFRLEVRGIGDTDLLDGSWFATSSNDKLSFELRAEREDHSWNSTLWVEKGEINPFPGQGNVEFKLVREAGTMDFKGQFDGQEGFGHFHYTPNESYYTGLKQMGVEMDEDRSRMAFFDINVKKDYVDMLIHNGYPHISERDLISFAAMKIDKDFIAYWRGSGYDEADNPRNLITLKAIKMDRAYVDELKAAGYKDLPIHDLISLKSMHIDGAYIRSLGTGKDGEPIPVRELISYKSMHIDSSYITEMRKLGYADLPRHDVISLYSMHVSPAYVKGLQDMGYKDIAPHDLTSLKAMDITPEYIKEFKDIGYNNLDTRQLTTLKSMHITPEYIKGFADIGYKDLETHQLTSFKAMGITPEFIKGFKDLGYTDLSANELGSLKSMNITPDFVRDFNKLGFDHIPVHTLTMLKATGVDADYVKKMKDKGFDSKDLGKYVRLKQDFN
jgi:rhodanese-related sulfurtransferase